MEASPKTRLEREAKRIAGSGDPAARQPQVSAITLGVSISVPAKPRPRRHDVAT
ncbi:hypothetical protein HMPREF9946_01637 [Acetobacteraceae bacterium AT-5844]|nr:hypothetical protein HMPREF9946_01637 [Acetobacteraceae bacterium AT-5844]